jgi:hypothetical protein
MNSQNCRNTIQNNRNSRISVLNEKASNHPVYTEHITKTPTYSNEYASINKVRASYGLDKIIADEVIPTKVHIPTEQSNTKKLPDLLKEMVKDEPQYVENNRNTVSSRVIKTDNQNFHRTLYDKVYGNQVNPSLEDNYLKVPNAGTSTGNYVSNYSSNHINRSSNTRV